MTYRELGVRPFINAAGTYTTLSGSRMPRAVIEAMDAASRHFVHIEKLQDAVGARIATRLGCEAAMVTSGAAGAMTLATAACITGGDPAAIARIPDVTGLRHEVVIQRAHRMGFDHAIRAAGARLVEVVTAEEMAQALSDHTAMAFFANWLAPEGRIGHEEFLAIAHAQGVPVLIDASADLPPVENLWAFTRIGFDLAAYSGGKGLRGPQSTGLLLGRRDLIAAARANSSPNEDSIGRAMKVG
jgi:L-seryl-tRNA(Ser) seleniumtransferase